eukprot:1157349-Pelagomonas_calceolata.AAC.18
MLPAALPVTLYARAKSASRALLHGHSFGACLLLLRTATALSVRNHFTCHAPPLHLLCATNPPAAGHHG